MARQAKRKGSGQMVYRWKVEKYQVDAQSAGEELQRIEQKYGGLRPYEIVTESRPETAPLHSCFLWDEREAAERYRLEQARELLRNIVVVNLVQPDTPAASEPVRAFVSLKGPQEQPRAYHSISVILSDPQDTDRMLQEALQELRRFAAKYRALKQLAGLFREIDRLQEQFPAEDP